MNKGHSLGGLKYPIFQQTSHDRYLGSKFIIVRVVKFYVIESRYIPTTIWSPLGTLECALQP